MDTETTAPQVPNLPPYERVDLTAPTNPDLPGSYHATALAYRDFVHQWRAAYRYVSARHRDQNLGGRLGCAEHAKPTVNLAGKRLQHRLCLADRAAATERARLAVETPDLRAWYYAQVRRASYPASVTAHGREIWYGNSVATWLLYLRARGKVHAKAAPWFKVRACTTSPQS
jgi:hypothetical protein